MGLTAAAVVTIRDEEAFAEAMTAVVSRANILVALFCRLYVKTKEVEC